MKKFVFVSRHQLSEGQIEDLQKKGFVEFETVNPGVLPSDAHAAAKAVLDIIDETSPDAIGLVAPGRVWTALSRTVWYTPVYEAESRQAPELRKGDGAIPFVHVKWHRVI